jgi:hypothetical protein
LALNFFQQPFSGDGIMVSNFSAPWVGSIFKCWVVAVARFSVAPLTIARFAIAPWVIATGIGLSDREAWATEVQDTPASTVSNQDPPAVPEILDQPRFVDPIEFLPAKLTKRVSVDLRSASLAELAEWLRTDGELTVLVQFSELEDEGISPSDPISDWLENEPIYLLLDRLRLMAGITKGIFSISLLLQSSRTTARQPSRISWASCWTADIQEIKSSI